VSADYLRSGAPGGCGAPGSCGGRQARAAQRAATLRQ